MKIEIKEEVVTKCKRCGRTLKNPKYKQIGFGPQCLIKIKNRKERKLF